MRTRRKFDAEFKAKVVLEMIRGEKGLMQASREYQIKDTVLSRWKQEFLEKAPEIFRNEKDESIGQDIAHMQELERMVGRMAMELDAAKKVFGISSSILSERKQR
jgi:transposase